MDIQGSFIYPNFKLMQDVLLDLELITPEDDMTSLPTLHIFNPTLDTWVKTRMDNFIELTQPMQKLFFKALTVTSYPLFD